MALELKSQSAPATIPFGLDWPNFPKGSTALFGNFASTADSQVSMWVIPTDEELMIAQHTLALVRP